MQLSNYELFEKKPVYETVRFNYDCETQESYVTLLLDLPGMELREMITIDLPFTDYDPSEQYKLPDFTFRDEESVFMNANTHERIQQFGLPRSMPCHTRYAYQCEYDEWIYDAGLSNRSGYLVWQAVYDYVLEHKERK